ncbi:hypothetical protein [Thioalkalivibrio sp.]|uniref:hypothetical protein n=1 Tax=Thioalkalivibrio sp. TaxID=2093813 RepID=UPI0025FB18AA|nr:hypothetical protein [Thioalkalivibrio sp.]
MKTDRSPRLAWVLVVLLVLLLILAGAWIAYLLQAQRDVPVTLTPQEQRALDLKLAALRDAAVAEPRPEAMPSPAPEDDADRALVPEIYAEDPDERRIRFTERELNAAIARDPALAGRAAIRLSPGQVSASFLIDVPEDLPLLGGRSLRVRTGLQLLTRDERLEARLLGISVGGVPLPDAWLGGWKGNDLLATSGLGGFGAGIEALEVREGELELLLAP